MLTKACGASLFLVQVAVNDFLVSCANSKLFRWKNKPVVSFSLCLVVIYFDIQHFANCPTAAAFIAAAAAVNLIISFGTRNRLTRWAVLLLYYQRFNCHGLLTALTSMRDTHRSASNENKLFSIAPAQASTSLFCLDASPIMCVTVSDWMFHACCGCAFFTKERELAIYH